MLPAAGADVRVATREAALEPSANARNS